MNRRGLALLLTLGVAATAPPASADDAADREALGREIFALRGPGIGEGDPGWTEWDPRNHFCSSWGGAIYSAAVECPGEAWKILSENFAAGEAIHAALARAFAAGDPTEAGPAAWSALEVTARSLGIPTSAVKCALKSYVHLTYPPSLAKDEWMTRIEALGDALDLREFFNAARTVSSNAQGWRALGDTTGEAATNAANQVSSGITQSVGWLDNFQKAAETFHVHFEAAIALDRARAEGNAERCFFEGAASDLASLETRAVDFLARTRRHVVDAEKTALCAIAGSWLTTAAMRRSLGGWPDLYGRLQNLHAYEQRARAIVLGLRSQRLSAEARVATDGRGRDEIVAGLEAIARALAEGGECADARSLLRDLERYQSEACFEAAWSLAGIGGSAHELRNRLIRLHNARDVFFPMVEAVAGEARALAASCQFDEARQRVAERFARFDAEWSPLTASGLAACWRPPWRDDEYPPDALRRELAQREAAIGSATASASAAAARARSASAACDWPEAMAALEALAAAVASIGCPAGHPETDRLTAALAAERAAFESRWAAVEPRQRDYEAAWRDLLASLEEELFRAEQPLEPGRCAAADRVLEMVGLGAGFVPPAECPPPPSLAEHRRRLAEASRRAEAARQLGRAELARLVPETERALARCAVDEAAAALAALAALPVVCGADRDGEIARLRAGLEALERRIEAFRGKIEPFAREWGEAYRRCSITGLLGVANRVAAWAGDRCAASALTPAEQARVRALEARDAAAVEALAARREGLRSRVRAKIAIAEGYLRTAEEALRRGDDPGHGRAQVERAVADAFTEVAATPDVPHACLEDLLERLAGLGDELEGILAALPATSAPEDCTTWPGTHPEPDPATGRLRCVCPRGTAWSLVRSACLSLEGIAGAAVAAAGQADCSGLPGTLPRRDPATGLWSCRCPAGEWDAGERRCVTPWEGLPDPVLSASGDSDFCEVLRTMIRQAVAMGERGQAERYAETARVAACVGIDDLLPRGGAGGAREAGTGRVSSRNVEICVTDANSVLDDHYTLVVNGGPIGTVQNPEGGRSCFRALLRGGENTIELRLIREMGQSTALVMSIHGGEYEGSFSGSHDHVWRITAP